MIDGGTKGAMTGIAGMQLLHLHCCPVMNHAGTYSLLKPSSLGKG